MNTSYPADLLALVWELGPSWGRSLWNGATHRHGCRQEGTGGRKDSQVNNKNHKAAFLIHALLTKETVPLHSSAADKMTLSPSYSQPRASCCLHGTCTSHRHLSYHLCDSWSPSPHACHIPDRQASIRQLPGPSTTALLELECEDEDIKANQHSAWSASTRRH